MGAARRLMGEGQFSVAGGLLKGVVADNPDMMPAWEMLVHSEASADDAGEVVAAFVSWHESGAPGAPDAQDVDRLEAAIEVEGMRGYWSWTLERLQERSEAGEKVSVVEMAAAHAGLGNDDEALQLLAEGLRQGDRGVLAIQADPVSASRPGSGGLPALRARRPAGLQFQPTHPGPRTNLPGVAPVCSPSRSTGTPLTRTWTIPVAYWWGSSKVAWSLMSPASNTTTSAK